MGIFGERRSSVSPAPDGPSAGGHSERLARVVWGASFPDPARCGRPWKVKRSLVFVTATARVQSS